MPSAGDPVSVSLFPNHPTHSYRAVKYGRGGMQKCAVQKSVYETSVCSPSSDKEQLQEQEEKYYSLSLNVSKFMR